MSKVSPGFPKNIEVPGVAKKNPNTLPVSTTLDDVNELHRGIIVNLRHVSAGWFKEWLAANRIAALDLPHF